MKIKFTESSGIKRVNEPVSFGVPFPRGHVTHPDRLFLTTQKGEILPFGHKVLATWPDHSIKWLLVDIQVSADPGETIFFELEKTADTSSVKADGTDPFTTSGFRLRHQAGRITIQSAQLNMQINTKGVFQPFYRAKYDGKDLFCLGDSAVVLQDAEDTIWQPVIEETIIFHDTLLRKTICTRGWFENTTRPRFLKFECLTHFFSNTPWVKFEFSICNTNAAVHPGGAWDLGDENAFYFTSLTVRLPLDDKDFNTVFYTPESGVLPVRKAECSFVRIYQDSSGHDNWFSRNHVNKDGHIPLQFRGYKIFHAGDVKGSGNHAAPFMGVAGRQAAVGVYVKDFWQNFPKSLAITKDSLDIGLFPEGFGDLFELQPGEQKTHAFYAGFAPDIPGITPLLSAVDPLVPQISCGAYHQAIPGPGPVPAKKGTQNRDVDLYDRLVAGFINKDIGYEQKNISIDEFGWRNFGDIFADHEAVSAAKDQIFVSHYNNQYDVIKGAVIQFMCTGEHQWFTLANHLADHVVDIDIYHTHKDKYQYNHGMFWHTDHHLDAHTSSHRTISAAHRQFKPDGAFGGGPSAEHNYATGLLYLYWITGHPKYRQAVKDLAGYIIALLEGPDTLSETIFQQMRHLAAKTKARFSKPGPRIYQFDGPCRASGNALNTLLDGYLITDDPMYLDHAQTLIVRAVHPEDDPGRMDLLNAEIRWFYTIFLQALGRYLDIRLSEGRVDDLFCYARDVLLNYAGWMAENEYPYLEKPEILEFPTETWAAQDLRKSDVFAWASFFARDPQKQIYEEKSKFFFSHAVHELSRFKTRHFTRPMALVMSNGLACLGMIHPDFDTDQYASSSGIRYDAGQFKQMQPNPLFLNQLFRNLTRFSFRKEWHWISLQVQLVLKR
ncbi:MAG: hypothetical protein K9K40_07135 [Desulfotignum sp.]|nr:hypothetical protein [Desulfotignum sp.]